ncbi:hypothetical protein [Sphingobacterium multivorum]
MSLFRERDGVLIIGDAATNMNLLTTVPGLGLLQKYSRRINSKTSDRSKS